MIKRPIIALYGGSFDPVHKAHVALVHNVIEGIHPESLNVVPCRFPPHKDSLHASDHDRVAMLRLAFAHIPSVKIDERELNKKDISYTYHTVAEIRKERGAEACIVFAIGLDSWQNFSRWYRWQDILGLCNLLVVKRPGSDQWQCHQDAPLQEYLREHQAPVAELADHPFGKIVFLETPEFDYASNQVRQERAEGKSIEASVPAEVAEYIHRQHLYLLSS